MNSSKNRRAKEALFFVDKAKDRPLVFLNEPNSHYLFASTHALYEPSMLMTFRPN